MYEEIARTIEYKGEADPFLPDQKCGIIHRGSRIYGGPREAITLASHEDILKEYICIMNQCTPTIFGIVK